MILGSSCVCCDLYCHSPGVAPTLLALRLWVKSDFRMPGSFLRLFSSELLPAPAPSGPNSQASSPLPPRFSPL